MKIRGIITLSILVSVLLVLSGAYLIQSHITKASEDALRQALTTVLNTTHQALLSWREQEKSSTQVWASDPRITAAVEDLLTANKRKEDLITRPSQQFLREHFKPIINAKQYQGYFIISPSGVNLSSTRDSNVGDINLLVEQKNTLYKIFSGESVMSLPQHSDVPLKDEQGNETENLPTMFSAAPIRNARGKIIAGLAFRINPSLDFTRITNRGRIGSTGETYAFNKDAVLISESRFDADLKKINLLEEGMKSILNIKLLNPGSNLLTTPGRPKANFLPKTEMARLATSGQSGDNLEGYRDYRGVNVAGAWLWDSEMNIGLTTEIDMDQAFHSLDVAITSIWYGVILSIFLIISMGLYFLSSSAKLYQALSNSGKHKIN